MIAQWTLFTSAARVFVGKTSTSNKINFFVFCWGTPREYVFSWGKETWFNATAKRHNFVVTPFVVSQVPLNTLLISAPNVSTLGLSVSIDCHYHDHLVSKTKLASKKLRVIRRVRQYFRLKHRLALHGVRFDFIWNTVYIIGLVPSVSLTHLIAKHRAVRIVGDPMKGLILWLCVETCPCCVFSNA